MNDELIEELRNELCSRLSMAMFEFGTHVAQKGLLTADKLDEFMVDHAVDVLVDMTDYHCAASEAFAFAFATQ